MKVIHKYNGKRTFMRELNPGDTFVYPELEPSGNYLVLEMNQDDLPKVHKDRIPIALIDSGKVLFEDSDVAVLEIDMEANVK